MAEGARLYRKAVTIALAYPEAFDDFRAPTAAELNDADFVHNITCALDESGTEFTLNDPDVDDSLSFCDEAGTETPTVDNPSVVLQIFRDLENDADAPTDELNKAFALLKKPDIPYYAILRVGKDSDEPFAVGDRVNIVGVTTDNPVRDAEVNGNVRLTNTMLPTGDINWRHEVAN